MARIAFLVFAHRNPPQVARLVRRLRTDLPDCWVVVRQDRRSVDLTEALPLDLGAVHLRDDGRPSDWGDWSLVERVIETLEWSLATLPFDWVVCLSGQDYPARALTELQTRLNATDNDGFVGMQPLAECSAVEQRRYAYRWFELRTSNPGVERTVRRLVGTVNARARGEPPLAVHSYRGDLPARVGLRRRRTPFNPAYRCWKGAAWWTLRRETAQYLVDHHRTDGGLRRYYRRTVVPDESYFHTILGNRPGIRLGDDLHYILWSRPPGPGVLRAGDADDIAASERMFARKVDIDVDSELLDILDERSAPP